MCVLVVKNAKFAEFCSTTHFYAIIRNQRRRDLEITMFLTKKSVYPVFQTYDTTVYEFLKKCRKVMLKSRFYCDHEQH